MKDEAGEETRPLAEWSNKMKTVTVLELKAKAGELVRSVMRTGDEIQIIDNGEVVALLVSTDEAKKNELAGNWTTLEQLAKEIRRCGRACLSIPFLNTCPSAVARFRSYNCSRGET